MVESVDKPCAVSQELIHLQCLQCGEVTSGNFISIAECRLCGALDYHIFKSSAAAEAPGHARKRVADTKDVVTQMIELVQRNTK